MLDSKAILPELKKLVTVLSEDLLDRVNDHSGIDAGLRHAYAQIEKGGRTGDPYEVWLEDYLDQVAVAWVLSCVFVRFMEDNELIDNCWLAGKGKKRQQAEDSHDLYFRDNPLDSDREYFEHVFREVGKIPACRDLFAEGKTPLWAVGPSGDAAMKLLAYWRDRDSDSGQLKRIFEVENSDTRFLGDLYQDLSERARKKFALLQTPVFVEEFILDRTLDPAIDEFGLKTLRMIDPTCGSGHFLLGGFTRLFRLWSKPENTSGNVEKDAQNALNGVWGCDVNPFAVAIARFRLIVAAVKACGNEKLQDAPGWKIHIAAGDSLLMGLRFNKEDEGNKEQLFFQTEDEGSWAPQIYACEDRETVNEILGQQYHVVVGNPPYIIVRDRVLNQAYRQRYSACHQKYSLAVPFMERFFDLAMKGSGYVGKITANSFMKREFGKKLIESFFTTIDLTHVIDTSGAYIPGHGTPTVVMFGRARKPVDVTVRAVLGIKGEPSTPGDPSQGKVWQSILTNISRNDAMDNFTSSADVPRSIFQSHPWSIGGGGASDVMEIVESNKKLSLSDVSTSIGFASFPGLDDAFVMDRSSLVRREIGEQQIRFFVYGESVRDWASNCDLSALAPYDSDYSLLALDANSNLGKHLWCVRASLESVVSFGGKTRKQCGDSWWGWYRWVRDKYLIVRSITFAFVATHNHFVLDRGGKVFNRSAPIIKLPADATVEDHLGLLGLLNSSTACFWMKQTFHNKGDSTDQHGARTTGEPEFNTFEFTGTGLQRFPIPAERPLELATKLDATAQFIANHNPEKLLASWNINDDLSKLLADGCAIADRLRSQMIAIQEELDWHCYGLYGLIESEDVETQRHREHGEKDTESTSVSSVPLCLNPPAIQPGQRAFEIVLARKIEDGESNSAWFRRQGFPMQLNIPDNWSAPYREVVQRRIDLIQSNNTIGLIEDGMYKRRWNTEPWEVQEQRALKNWLLDRLETERYRAGSERHPELISTAAMADRAISDGEFRQVAEVYRGKADYDLTALITELVTAEAVPLLPAHRYKPAGHRKRELWERTWEMQRQEDAGKQVGPIPVPPKYGSGDFLKTDFWRLRGKLDVAKERWISFSNCSTDSDPSLVVLWAGYNHLQQASAIVAYYDARKREGWTTERLIPLLAGLDQLLPWLHQWHPEIDPEYNESAGTSFQTLLESEAQELGLTLEQIRNWTPPAKARAAKKSVAKQPKQPRQPRKKKAKAEVEE